MKIVANNIDSKSSTGSIVLIPTSSDDLYILSSIIAAGDEIEATTTRKLSLDGGKTQQKITLKLALKAETIEVDLEDGIMYIKGKTCKEHEHVHQGSYHTLNIALETKFGLKKDNWTGYDQKKIKESTNEVPELCFVIFYEKDCVVSSVSSSSIVNIYKEEVKGKNFKMVFNNLLAIKDKIKTVIIASYSEIRNDFYKVLLKEHKVLEKQAVVIKLGNEYKNISNTKVIGKVLTDESFKKTFSEIRYVDDLREIEVFFRGIQKGSKDSCIGMEEIKEAFEYGAIKTLFITDQLYRPKTVEGRKYIEGIVKQANGLRAKICIIPVIHEHGEKLKAVGGIAGTLLFNFK